MSHTTRVSLDTPNEILTTRLLDAPLALVWRAFTESGHVEQWWGPVGFTTTTERMDVRTGGEWRHTMHGPDGSDYPNLVAYSEVVPMQRLIWQHGCGGEPLFRASVTFEAQGERTLITLRHVFVTGEARDANIAQYGAVQGAIDTTNRLADYLVGMPDERDFLITRDYDAPQALLWQAWTEASQIARWWGPAVFANTTCESDTRVGGRYRIVMRGPFPGPAESDYPVFGEYIEVTAPERLVMTVDCSDNPAWWHDGICPDRSPDNTNPAGVMLQTVSLQALDATRTRLTIRTRMVSAEILAAMQRIGMREGWSESLERLESLLAQMHPVPA